VEGIVNLKPLYGFVRKNRGNIDAMLVNRATRLGNEYRAICERVIKDVQREAGIYLWGFYNKWGFWTNIYVGMAEKKITASLFSRLYKELTAERACVWREVYRPEELRRICRKIHPRRLRSMNLRAWDRSLEKAGTTHIVWMALPDKLSSDIKAIEKDIIEAMNPTGNRRRSMPPQHLREDTKEIFGRLRAVIHQEENRSGRFQLDFHKDYWKNLG
jgi:hypothetical protein